MTREEAIEILNRDDDSMRKGYFCINDFTAIEVLKSDEPSEDCVSRQAVDELCFRFLKANSDDNIAFYEHFRELPSVTPTRKKGKWIDGHCSECGCDVPAYVDDWKWTKDMDAKFCPNCGAEMESEE